MASEEYEEAYEGYKIKIHYQPVTGDNAKVFFRVFKGPVSIFSVWEQISGTSMRDMARDKAFDFLKEKGLVRIKSMIDTESFIKNKEYSYWEEK